MRFCTVLGYYPKDTPGGAEFQSYLIAREMARRGHKAHYVAYCSAPEGLEVDGDVTVHRLNTEYSSPKVPSEILEVVKDINPDYTYFRNFPDLYILKEVQDNVNTKTIFNISHDRQCLRLYNNWRQLLSLSNIYKWLTNPSTYLTRSLLDVPDYRFVQTQYQERLLHKNFGLDSSYVGNGHPVPENLEPKEKPPIVLWLASLKSWKRPKMFLSLAEACRDLDCRFWLVGRPVNDDLAQEVIGKTEELPNAEYKGGCSFEESNEFIERASLFVNTSKQEGFPNTFIQSWLRRTPVVSLDVDPDGILDEYEIGTFANGDYYMLVNSVRRLMTDATRRERLGKNARKYGQSNHDISAIADRILNTIYWPTDD